MKVIGRPAACAITVAKRVKSFDVRLGTKTKPQAARSSGADNPLAAPAVPIGEIAWQ
jgi:hypothetical protein